MLMAFVNDIHSRPPCLNSNLEETLVTAAIDPSLREKLPVKGLTDIHSSSQALGLEWDSESDKMSTSLNPFSSSIQAS